MQKKMPLTYFIRESKPQKVTFCSKLTVIPQCIYGNYDEPCLKRMQHFIHKTQLIIEDSSIHLYLKQKVKQTTSILLHLTPLAIITSLFTYNYTFYLPS